MPDITEDVKSITEFRRSPAVLIERLRKTKRPIVLTIKGKPAAVVQEAAEYQRLLDIAARADVEEGIRQGLADVAAGRTRPAAEAFEQIRGKYAIPR